MQICKFICTYENFLLTLRPNSSDMKIANKKMLQDFVDNHAGSAASLTKWINKVSQANCTNHNELKQIFPSADYVKNGRYVFNVGGNNYRIVAVVIFVGGVMTIRFVGTHAEYSKIDCATI